LVYFIMGRSNFSCNRMQQFTKEITCLYIIIEKNKDIDKDG